MLIYFLLLISPSDANANVLLTLVSLRFAPTSVDTKQIYHLDLVRSWNYLFALQIFFVCSRFRAATETVCLLIDLTAL